MAKCPGINCKVEWQWDWNMDSYRNKKTGEYCIQSKDFKFISKKQGVNEEIEFSLFICTQCKKVISVQVNDPQFGVDIFNHPFWGRLDFQSKAHSYDYM